MASRDLSELKGKKLLIAGDVGTGKTACTAKLLEKIMKQAQNEEITILDFAPMHGNIGGQLKQYLETIPKNYFAPQKVRAPRLEGKSKAEVIKLATENAKSMALLLKRYLENPTKYLIINDVSLYLQAGDCELLGKCLRKANTAILNSYYGSALSEDKGSNISSIERRNVEKLMEDIDIVMRL